MKNNYFIIIQLLLLIILSCEKDDFIDIEYDCFILYNNYNESGVIDHWSKEYYKNDLKVKEERSNNLIFNYEYDAYGNVSVSSHIDNKGVEWKTVFTYDNYNNVIERVEYRSGQLSSYTLNTFLDNQKIYSYSINSLGDTISCSRFYYENNLLSHAEYDWYNDHYYHAEYYYYSDGLDSTLTYNKSGRMIGKRYYRFLDEKMIYMESFSYDSNNELYSHAIITNEFENNLLTRRTNKVTIRNELRTYTDYRYSYNADNLQIRLEYYDESGSLLQYTTFMYDNGKVIKRESFDQSGTLISYMLAESTCN